MTPSRYQLAVYDWVQHGQGCARVQAVAGSGKTTTLVGAARLVQGRGLFLAFNKAIIRELTPRLEGTAFEARTCHSLGLSIISGCYGRPEVDGRKYDQEIHGWADRAITALEAPRERRFGYVGAIRRLFDLGRLTLTIGDSPRPARELVWGRSIDADSRLVDFLDRENVLGRLMAWGIDELETRARVDFGDMVALPEYLDLPPPRGGRYDWLFVDECQDLSRAQRGLVQRVKTPDGRVLLVGDEYQAIYGWAGADCDAVRAIDVDFGCEVLPLSICYRCPSSHVALAAELVPDIEARPDAPEGIVDYLEEGSLAGMLRGGDMILCRTTAPLVGLCLRLLAAGVPSRVKGRDIGAGLIRFVESGFDRCARLWEDIREGVAAEFNTRMEGIALLSPEERERPRVVLEDTYQAVLALLPAQGARGPLRGAEAFRAWAEKVSALFDDAEDGRMVQLSVVHRAKGLEADRVFLIRPELLPLKWRGQTAEEEAQEWNLRYVALTRAKQALYFVDIPKEE